MFAKNAQKIYLKVYDPYLRLESSIDMCASPQNECTKASIPNLFHALTMYAR